MYALTYEAAIKRHTLEVAVAPLCQLPVLMAELPDMPDRVSALRLRPVSCLLCGMQTVTCTMQSLPHPGRHRKCVCMLLHGGH